MATIYWDPSNVTGNAANYSVGVHEGLSKDEPLLLISECETQAGSGGTIILVSGTHSMSGPLTFAGGRTYTSENTKNRSILQWSYVEGDRISISAGGDTIINYLIITGLKYTGTSPIYTSNGTYDLTIENCDFNTWGRFAGGGHFIGGGAGPTGTFTFEKNTVNAKMYRNGASIVYFFHLVGGTVFKASYNSFYVDYESNDVGLHVVWSVHSSSHFRYNNLKTSKAVDFYNPIFSNRSYNNYWEDSGTSTIVLTSTEQWVDSLFIGPDNGNLKLLPNSPALASNKTTTPDWYYDSNFVGVPSGSLGEIGNPFTSLADINSTNQPLLSLGDIVQVVNGTHSDVFTGMDFVGFILEGKTKNGAILDITASGGWGSGTSTLKFRGLNINLSSRITALPSGSTLSFDNTNLNITITALTNGLSDTGSAEATFEFINGTVVTSANSSTNTGRAFMRNHNVNIINSALSYTNVNAGNIPRLLNGGTHKIINSTVYNSGEDISGTFGPTGDNFYNSIVIGISSAPQGGTNWVDSDGDPLLADLANGNFELLPNSPAITSGSLTTVVDAWVDPNNISGSAADSTGGGQGLSKTIPWLTPAYAKSQLPANSVIGVVDGNTIDIDKTQGSDFSGMYWKADTEKGSTVRFEAFDAHLGYHAGDFFDFLNLTTVFDGFLIGKTNTQGFIPLSTGDTGSIVFKNCSTDGTLIGRFAFFGSKDGAANGTHDSNITIEGGLWVGKSNTASAGLFHTGRSGAVLNLTVRSATIQVDETTATGTVIFQQFGDATGSINLNGVSLVAWSGSWAVTSTPLVEISTIYYNITGGNPSFSGDPLFIDPANGNFNLLPNSPARKTLNV